MRMNEYECGLLILGSGIAGMTAALRAAADSSVILVTKSELREGATRHAQGGVAAAMSPEDSPELHMRDTLEAGAGLCDARAVEVLVNEGGECLRELISLGAAFDQIGSTVSLRLEGGHSAPRVVHAGDTTGSEIERTLSAAVRADPRITVIEHAFLSELVVEDGRCTGARALLESGPALFRATDTLLATGGAGRLFSATTNPPISTGDGIAAAYRAGARIGDMEFVQFHPTALLPKEGAPAGPLFLISEALRGEGAVLRDSSGGRFMAGRHPLADLAPRDVVVSAMVEVMLQEGSDRVYLDLRPIGTERLAASFPAIHGRLLAEGYDPSADLIPVTFAAHYLIGGVVTDHFGRSTLPHLYASGEAACTGIHGANRLASNSLLEGLVFSRRAVRARASQEPWPGPDEVLPVAREAELATERPASPRLDEADAYSGGDTDADADDLCTKIGALMTAKVGVIREERTLHEAIVELAGLERSASTSVQSHPSATAAWEALNLATIGGLCARAALVRTESRGAHRRSDHPLPTAEWSHAHVVFDDGVVGLVEQLFSAEVSVT